MTRLKSFCASNSMIEGTLKHFDYAMLMLYSSVSVCRSLLMCYKSCFRDESDKMEFKSEKPGSNFL